MEDTVQSAWIRLFRLLYFVVVLLLIVGGGTLVAVFRTTVWHNQLLRLSHRTWIAFLGLVGSTGPGFISPILVSIVSIAGAIACIGYLQGWVAMRKHIWENAAITALVSFAALSFIYGPQFVWEFVKTSYDDHQSLTRRLAELHMYAQRKQQFDDELRQARSEAERWRAAYTGVSRGEIHPDRVLNTEERSKLFELLKDISKEPRNKAWTVLEIGSVQDREASHLGNQLFTIFREAHWKITGRRKLGKDLESNPTYLYPLGILILTDDQNKGTGLAGMLRDVGLPEAYVNPYGAPQGFKGTLIWIGYKQYN